MADDILISAREKVPDNIEAYVYELSKELNIGDVDGVIGNELELIALVRNCPFLYDQSHVHFKDIQKREIAWTAIANVMHSKTDECQHRWRCLREMYSKVKRKFALGDPSEIAKYSSWEFLEDLKFLDPHIRHRRRTAQLTNKQNSRPQFTDWDDESIGDGDNGSLELKLIRLIRKNPHLYDNSVRSNIAKEDTWIEIADEMGNSVSNCQNRWKTLRERFVRERKGESKWPLFEEMSFIGKYIKTRRSRNYLSFKSDNKVNKSPDKTNVLRKILPKVDSDQKLIKLENIEFIETDQLVQSPESVTSLSSRAEQQTSVNSSVQRDEDFLFAQSIAAELNKITSRKKKIKLKADIFKMLCEATSDSD